MKLKKLTGSREFLLFIIVIAMFAIVSIINPAFFSPSPSSWRWACWA